METRFAKYHRNSSRGTTKYFYLFLLVSMCFYLLSPVTVYAQEGFHFVTCGRDTDNDGIEPSEQCTFKDLILLIVRVINYLISVAAVVAMYQILLAGWNLMTALGVPEKIEKGKEGISRAVIGFAIIILAFVFVNLLVNGIFGTGDPTKREWWEVECIYDPSRADCPFKDSNPN